MVIKLPEKFYKINIDKKNIKLEVSDLLKDNKGFIETHLKSSIIELDEYKLEVVLKKFDIDKK